MPDDIRIWWDDRYPEVFELVEIPTSVSMVPDEVRELAGRMLDAALRVERAGKEAARG